MKMTEGFERTYSNQMEIFQDTIEDDSQLPDTIILLAHAKDMAEALDDMVKACNQGYGRDIQKMERALERFKSWK